MYLKFDFSSERTPPVLQSFSGFYIHVFPNILSLLGVSFEMSYYQKKTAKT